MIYAHIPYTPKEYGTNLGYAYNKFMELLPNNDDWGCFLDHDAMFTTKNWYHQLEDIIKKYPNIGAFGARTNRINSTYQLVGNIDVYNHDMFYHREIGEHIQKKYYYNLFAPDRNTAQRGFSGVLILIKKSQWKEMGGFKRHGFNHVDNDIRWRLEALGKPIYIMNGVYVYHWYKADDPYERCVDKFKELDKHYKNNNKPFNPSNIFLYKGRASELPQ